MTLENGLILLEKYKKQMEDPRDENGRQLHGDQKKHAQEQSKANYERMLEHIAKKREAIKKMIGNPDPKFKVYQRYKGSELLKEDD